MTSTPPDGAAVDANVSPDGAGGDAARGVYTGMRPADRVAGTRAPLTRRCDPIDPLRCQLPWPSNTFTVADATSPTGLRVHVDATLVGEGDMVGPLQRADGFSRATPLAVGFAARLDERTLGDATTGAVRLFVAQPGETQGNSIPLRMISVNGRFAGNDESLVVAYPRVPLAPATDYVAVVTDALRAADGSRIAASIATRVALGLEPPADADEAALYAYHAPTRALLTRAGVDPNTVLRVWDFTTRSAEDPRRALRAMRTAVREAVDAGSVTVRVNAVTTPADGPIAATVLASLVGVPDFRTPGGALRRDAQGMPMAMGTHEASFRVAIPRGTGSYRVVLYGHGTGGNERDDAFDRELTEAGAAKIGVRFEGLTDDDTVATFESLGKMFTGADGLAGKLLQSYADAFAILRALSGPLATTLSAPMLGTMPNPAAGRTPDVSRILWAGGSLGGTSGLVLSSAEPEFAGAVLNVPGAAWTHFLTLSNLFPAVSLFLRESYRTNVDIQLAVAMGQGVLDEIDGCAWADARMPAPPRLLQESIGDPVLPNPGTDFAATASGAVMVGAPIVPIVGLREGAYSGGSAITQFRVPAAVTDPLDVHGFGARNTPAGLAAREQIVGFVRSIWAGSPSITLPSQCVMNTPANSCDFRGR